MALAAALAAACALAGVACPGPSPSGPPVARNGAAGARPPVRASGPGARARAEPRRAATGPRTPRPAAPTSPSYPAAIAPGPGAPTRLVPQSGPEGSRQALAVSPDGTAIVTGWDHGRVVIWDRATGALRARLGGHRNEVRTLAWSPDGRRLATADDVIRIWDDRTGALRATVGKAGRYIRTFAWSRDSQRLATFQPDEGVALFTADGARLGRLAVPKGFVSDLAWGGGRLLVGLSGGAALVYDGKTRALVARYAQARGAATLSADGKTVAFVDATGALHLAEAGNPATRRIPARAGQKARSFAWSRAGTTLAVAYVGGDVVLADRATGKVLRAVNVGVSAFQPLFTPGDRHVVVSCNQKQVFYACVLDGRSLTLVRRLDASLYADAPPHGLAALRFRGYALRTFDLRSGALERDFRAPELHPAWRPGPLEVTAAGALDVAGRAFYPWTGRAVGLAPPQGSVGGVRSSRDGRTLAWTRIAGKRERAEVLDLATGRATTSHDWKKAVLFPESPDNYQYRPSPVESFAFAPDGRWLALLGPGKTVAVLDARTGAPRLTTPAFRVAPWRLAPSPDSRHLAVLGYDGNRPTVTLVDVRARRAGPKRRLGLAHADGLAWAADGKTLWLSDYRGGVEARTIPGWRLHYRHPGRAGAVTPHPRGERVAVYGFSADPLAVWDTRTRRRLWTHVAPYAHAVQWSPDGTLLAVAAGRHVTVHDGRTGARRVSLTTGHRFFRRGYHGETSTIAWTPDGKALLVAGGCTLAWRVRDGARARYCLLGHPPYRKGAVHGIWTATDGASGGHRAAARLYRQVTGGLSGPFRSAPFTPGKGDLVTWMAR